MWCISAFPPRACERPSWCIAGSIFASLTWVVSATSAKKWIHQFQNVTALFFVVSLADFCETLEEDGWSNQLLEALKLFNDIVNNRWFTSTPVLIFFNHMATFAEKLKQTPLTVCFPDYADDPHHVDTCLEFVKQKFLSTSQSESRIIYHHQGDSEDAVSIEVLFETASDIFLARNLRARGYTHQ